MTEPHATATLLAVLGLLMAVSVVASSWAGRLRVPVALLFLAVGMIAGVEGVGGLKFSSYQLAFRLGTVSLVLILWDGGLGTSAAALRRSLAPGAVLATLGVVLTAGLMALAAHLLGFPWPPALLLGAVVSSTDAALVFSVLRGSRVSLTRRVATTLELESGLNDPVAVVLTLALTEALVGPKVPAWRIALEGLLQLGVGLAAGVIFGGVGRVVFRRLTPGAVGLLPVLSVALAFAAFGTATLARGSGFLAVYVAGAIVGNGPLPYRHGLIRVHDALAWMGQVVMFLVLGLLVIPSRLWSVGWVGVGLSLVLAFIARPIAVAVCLVPFRYKPREIGYVGWVGLRGAVPIILAMAPVLAGVPDAGRIFDVTFFIVVMNAIIPGMTVKSATKPFRVETRGPPHPAAAVEIASTRPMHADVLAYYIDPACAVAGARLSEIELPRDAAVMLVVRGEDMLAARGETEIRPGDHVYVFCRPSDRAEVGLLFGEPAEE